MEKLSYQKLMQQDLQGKVWAMPTDTIPGFSCRADDLVAIEKINKIKKRPEDKNYIVLVSSTEQLLEMGVYISDKHTSLLDSLWPGPVSVVLPGYEETAFRVPGRKQVRELCAVIGPIVSTSANVSGSPALTDIDDITRQFGSQLDFVLDEPYELGTPSSLIKILR